MKLLRLICLKACLRLTTAVVLSLPSPSLAEAQGGDERSPIRFQGHSQDLRKNEGKVIFLDNKESVVNGSALYDPNTRTCGDGEYRVFTDLDEAARALADADVLYIRGGTYTRASVGKYITVHGHRVNYFTGVLDIAASGTAQRRKLLSAYFGETAVIQARPGVNHYNPDPGDTSFTNSSHYYPHPAIGIHGDYLDVRALKTYGQVVISGHDITLEYCDLGGGGPHMNQGQVVAINSNRPGGVYNVVVRNNRVHHSCWGESRGNGAAVMGYNFSAIIENNHFYDNYGADVRIKDCGDQQGKTTIVRCNFFGPTAVCPDGNTGVGGMNQDKDVDRILIHNNIFYKKTVGVSCDGPPEGPLPKGMFVYNNSFVNCEADLSEWTNPPIHAHNNLFYHFKEGQRFYDIQSDPWSQLDADHNLFYSATGDTQWRHLYRNRGSDLAAWQRYSGKDANSVWRVPQFVSPFGGRPGDFKRKGRPSDVSGSKYGPVCGAYITGNEIIGVMPTDTAVADLNGDEIVDFTDFALLSNKWLSAGCDEIGFWCGRVDMNRDAVVDFLDLACVASDWCAPRIYRGR